ncbi:MAG: DUF3284 domain-containing protein [Coriobacteriaceae bacterium]|nr:DUF3284 domain-containing protein [Coriobacteriaceae bacterium]
MKVQVKLNVSAEDFFAAITRSVLYDAEQARGKKIPVKKLKAGFTYQKSLNAKIGGAQHVTTKITEFEPPRLYAASIISSKGENTVRYELEPVAGERAFTLTYEEGYAGDKTLNDLNGKLVGFFYGPSAKRKIKRRFRDMEAYIKQNPGSDIETGEVANTAESKNEE